MDKKRTVIIGATPNPARYAYRAAHMLDHHGHTFIPVGIKKGEIAGKTILDLRQKPPIEEVDTVTLYIGPQNQPEWEDYILSLRPRRIIFNPGTENLAFANKATQQGINTEEACTLVMLQLGMF